jgi:hypothetical protein
MKPKKRPGNLAIMLLLWGVAILLATAVLILMWMRGPAVMP